MNILRVVYLANIIVARWISTSCLFYPKGAVQSVFTNTFQYSESIRLIGALWFGIFMLSIVGLFYPVKMSLILVFQLVYKFSWLLFAALPALLNKNPYPKSMSIFFVVWVIVLPFVIPWKSIFS